MSNPSLCQIKIRVYLLDTPVPDTDLELKGGLVIQTPQIRGGGARSSKKFLFGLKIRLGGGLPGPLPWIRHSIHRGLLGVGTRVPNLNFKTHHFRY